TFQLTYNGKTTASLPFRASATQVRNELNNLTTIGAAGVTVAMNEVYSGISEVQRLSFTNAITGTTKFQLTFGGSTTGVLTFNGAATAADIANALNATGFATIGGLAPFAGTANAGQVSVGADPTGTVFTIPFGGELQDQPLSLMSVAVTSATGTGSAAIQRVQSGSGVPTDVYTVTFSGTAFAGQAVLPLSVSASSTGE